LNAHQPLQDNNRDWLPRQRVQVDLFTDSAGTKWLVMADDFSGDVSPKELKGSPCSDDIIRCYARLFAGTELPEVLRSDGEKVLSSNAVQLWLQSLQVQPTVSSPGLSETNGRAEAAVKSARSIIDGVKQLHRGNAARAHIAKALVAHRNPLRYGATSAAAILNGRRANDGLPSAEDILGVAAPPVWDDNRHILACKAAMDQGQYRTVRPLPPLHIGQRIVAQDHLQEPFHRHGVIADSMPQEDYLIVDKATGNTLRRNRRFLRPGVLPPAPTGNAQPQPRPPSPLAPRPPAPAPVAQNRPRRANAGVPPPRYRT
jgi:hypothetical protein